MLFTYLLSYYLFILFCSCADIYALNTNRSTKNTRKRKRPIISDNQPSLSSFHSFNISRVNTTYISNHPTQQVLTQSIVANLIVG